MSKHIVRFLFLLFVIICSVPVFAQNENNLDIAEEYVTGVKLYNNAQYSDAIDSLVYVYLNDQYDEYTDVEGMLKKAFVHQIKKFLAASRFDEALDYLKRARSMDFVDENADDEYQVQIALKRSHIACFDGNIEKAAELFRSAYGFQDMIPNFKDDFKKTSFDIGFNAYKAKQYLITKEFFEIALSFDNKNKYTIYQALTEIAYMQNDFKKAEYYLEKGLSVAKDDWHKERATESLEKVKKDKGETKNKREVVADKFAITFVNKEQQKYKTTLVSLLREARRTLGRTFNYYPTDIIKVAIGSRESLMFEADKRNVRWNGRQSYDSTLHVNKEDLALTASTELKAAIWYEYVSLLVSQLSHGHCPLWFESGIAEHEKNKIQKSVFVKLSNAYAKNTLIPFEKIATQQNDVLSRVDPELFYEQSFSMVSYFFSRYRMPTVRKIFDEMNGNMSFSEAFKKHTYMSLQGFEKKWLNFLKESELGDA